MGYDRGDSFLFDFEPNVFSFCSKSKGKGNGNIVFPLDRKTSNDRLIAVRETGVPRHQGGPIEGLPEPPVHHSTTVLRALRGYLTWAPKEMEI